jgi:hypothetical protein
VTALCGSDVNPGDCVALRDDKGNWYAIDPSAAQLQKSDTLTLRRSRQPEPADEARLPVLVNQVMTTETRFFIVENGKSQLLATIPNRLPECPPRQPNDTDPPSPHPTYPGYFVYYFWASSSGATNAFQGVLDAAGFAAVPFGLAGYFSGELGEYESGRISVDDTPYQVFQASPPLGFLGYASTGLYGTGAMGASDFEVFEDWLAAQVAANQRLDFGFWNVYDIRQGINTLATVATEVVVSLVPGVPAPGGGFTPQPMFPAAPSGNRRDVLRNYYGPGIDAIGELANNGNLNGGHPWARSVVRVPPPYNPPDPNDPNDPRNTARENTVRTSISADESATYVAIQDKPKCRTEGFERFQYWRIAPGLRTVQTITQIPNDDLRAKYLKGDTIPADPCLQAYRPSPTANLFGNIITELTVGPVSLNVTAYYNFIASDFAASIAATCTLRLRKRDKIRFKRPTNLPNDGVGQVIGIAPFLPL